MSSLNEQMKEFASDENQDLLRRRVKAVVRDNKFTLSKISRLMDLSTPTLINWIEKKEKTRLEVLLKIEEFVTKMEKPKKD
jgi:hypothetical protein